ncbi:MAG: CopG family transcriptional regulator [Rhodospirillales bacterium]|nr:CopG family transcriptional regulator [Rhodospirillales bacterium]
MRTIVDLPEKDVKLLDVLGQKENVSRAELVRRAVSGYLEAEKNKSADMLDQYFGLLKDSPDVFDGLDGLAWQDKMRSEWADRDADISRRQGHSDSLHDSAELDFKHGAPQPVEPSDKK